MKKQELIEYVKENYDNLMAMGSGVGFDSSLNQIGIRQVTKQARKARKSGGNFAGFFTTDVFVSFYIVENGIQEIFYMDHTKKISK